MSGWIVFRSRHLYAALMCSALLCGWMAVALYAATHGDSLMKVVLCAVGGSLFLPALLLNMARLHDEMRERGVAAKELRAR